MEQTNQQLNQKISLPTKTKIAAWWIIGVCIMGIILMLNESPTVAPAFLPLLLIFFPSLFLYQRKKWALTFSVLGLVANIAWWSFVLIMPVEYYLTSGSKDEKFLGIFYIIFWFLLLMPFVLLLSDRKNFLKITIPSIMGYEPIIKVAKLATNSLKSKILAINLPIKTKVAAWWMMIVGGTSLVGFFSILLEAFGMFPSAWLIPAAITLFVIVGIPLLFLFFLLIAGYFILFSSRKREAWKFAIGTLLLNLAFQIPFIYFKVNYLNKYMPSLTYIIPFSLLVPLVFLLLDRKNFWKTAT